MKKRMHLALIALFCATSIANAQTLSYSCSIRAMTHPSLSEAVVQQMGNFWLGSTTENEPKKMSIGFTRHENAPLEIVIRIQNSLSFEAADEQLMAFITYLTADNNTNQ